MTGDCYVLKFPRRRVDGKHLMRFQIETSVFKFLQRSVIGASLGDLKIKGQMEKQND